MGRPPKYPWPQWLAPGQPPRHIDCWELDVKPASLASQIRAEARRKEIHVEVEQCRSHRACVVLRRLGRARRSYDWDRILNGRPYPFTRSEFTSWESLVRSARREAARRGVGVRVKHHGEQYWIQARDI